MFAFNYAAGASAPAVIAVWVLVLAALYVLNEVSRRSKLTGFLCFVILPAVLSVLWFTVLRDKTYLDWFHLVKVYSSTAGCIGFWCIRFIKGKDKAGKEWKLSENKWALCFPPLILSINILEAVARDFQVGSQYSMAGGGMLADEAMHVIGGSWNYMNGIAGLLNIVTITGWFGIVLRKKTKSDGSKDMLWPDMLWFWIIAYDLWNLSYCYNCISTRSMYAGFILLLSCTISEFVLKKGAWLQHRAQTLALWAMFSITFSSYAKSPLFSITSSYKPAALLVISVLSIGSNLAVFAYEIAHIAKTKRNPITQDVYVDLKSYKAVLADNNLV